MPLGAPPASDELARLPSRPLAGSTLHRVHRAGRSPWWFASIAPGDDPGTHGRFDLPHPLGSCYLATTLAGALVEALADLGPALIPDSELAARRWATIRAPRTAPAAAWLTAKRSRATGVTAALWAGENRALTQAWAWALLRAGWRALFTGVQHDPAGQLRAVTLLDQAGEHPPFDDEGWQYDEQPLLGDSAVEQALRRFGITLTRSDVQLATVRLEDSGLLD